MAYSDFTTDAVFSKLGLESAQGSFTDDCPEVSPSPWLTETLLDTIPLAVGVGTEKARSELLIMPILLDVRRHLNKAVSIFSGVAFNVEPERGLVGVCDFLLSASTNQIVLEAPLVTVVEAKKDDLRAGWGQCAAELVAARIFNRRAGLERPIFGVVTTGTIWQFLKLEENRLLIESAEWTIRTDLAKILGILVCPFLPEGN